MTESQAIDKLKDLLSTIDYSEFVKDLAVSANDPKIRNLLDEKLTEGKPFYIRKSVIPVNKLIPMQNEIDTTKSLQYSLTHKDSCERCFDKKPIVIKLPLFTYDGKYIVDGHHRWSQVYCINPDAKMECFDLLAHLEPIDVLKIIQVKIAADTGKVKVAIVEGSNLLKENLDKLSKYIDDTIVPEVEELLISKYKVNDKSEVVDEIINNIKLMRKTSQPIKGAPERGVMPQTDAIPELANDVKNGEVGQETLKNFSSINSRLDTIDYLYNL